MLDRILASELVWRIGWTLLHSIWQLVLIAVLTSLIVASLSRRSANARYWVACGGLALFYVPIVATFVWIPPRTTTDTAMAVVQNVTPSLREKESGETLIAPAAAAVPQLFPTQSRTAEVASVPDPIDGAEHSATLSFGNSLLAERAAALLPWLVGVWVTVVGVLSISNLGGCLVVQRLKQSASLPTTNETGKRMQQLAKQMGILQTVRLLESLQIDTPMVIGWLRPAVLLPTSVLTGLSPDELDAVLAHELAHIRRYDYLINLLQTFTETLLFYHPAVWLLSRRIRIEREYCCDDAAISVCGNKVNYARALAAVESCRQTPQLAMSFLGRNRNMTLDRVRRIMGVPVRTPNAWLNGSGAALLTTAVVIAIVFTQSAGNAAPGKADGWGKQVDGVQTRLRPDKEKWQEGTTIAFKAVLRNRGQREFIVTGAQQTCELEFDGKWYNWSSGYSLKSSPLSPEKKHKDLRISLVEDWKSNDGHALPLTVGRHTVRVAFTARPPSPKASDALPSVRVISNSVEIEIIGGDKTEQSGWGEEMSGLKTRLTARTHTFRAGHSVSLTLEIKNVSTNAQNFGRTSVTHNDQFEVLDQFGKPVPYLAGPSQLLQRQVEIQPGETQAVAAFDLAESYYLRAPGPYSVKFRGISLPPSGTLKLEVTHDQAAASDPIGLLLPLVKKNWQFVAPSGERERHPGANWQPTNCRLVMFNFKHRTSKREHDFVQVFLADEAAKEHPKELVVKPSASNTKYLGKISRWHVYYLASPGALKAWPNAIDDITRSLQTVNVKHVGGQQRQAHDPIATLANTLKASRGLWINGLVQLIRLPEYASPKDLLEQAISQSSFHEGKIASYRILESRKIELNAGLTGYSAALIDSNLGQKIFVFKYEGEQQWWNRFYEVAVEQDPINKAPKKPTPETEIDQQTLDKLVAAADLIADVRIVSEPGGNKGASIANYMCDVDLRRVFKTNHNVQSPLGVNITRRGDSGNGDELPINLPIKKGVTGILFLKRHPVVSNPPYITTDTRTGILESTPALHKAIQESLKRTTKATGPAQIKTRNGVFVQSDDNASTLLELKDGKFRYWFDSDEFHKPRHMYPLSGDYSIEASKLTLHNELIPESQSTWTFYKLNGNVTVWSQPALQHYQTQKKLAATGILEQTVQTADEAYKTLHVKAKIHSPQIEWLPNEIPELMVDVHNQGPHTFHLSPRQPVHEIEVDGKWYFWNSKIRVLGTGFPPGAKHTGIHFQLDPNVWSPRDSDQREPARLKLTPGQHVARVAIILRDSNDREKRWRTLTNRFVFHITDRNKQAIAAKAVESPTTQHEKETAATDEAAPTQIVRERNISWRYHGKAKHVWVSEVTDDNLAELSEDDTITSLSLASDMPNGNRITGPGIIDNRPMMTDTGLMHISKMTNLRTLILPHESMVTDEGLVHLQELQNLRELWLDFIPFTDAGVAHLKNLTKLRVLRFFDAKITDKGMANFRDMTDLEDLQLGHSLITDASMPMIGKMTKLKTLDLRTKVTDEGLVHLQNLTNLTWLCLDDNEIGDEGMSHVSKLRDLDWLMLENTSVSDQGIEKISALPNLTTLYLSGTKITDEGIDAIVKLPKLQRLKLNQTLIGDRGFKKLATMKQLKEVEIRRTLVTAYGIRDLQASNPNLKIIADTKPAAKNLITDGSFETPNNTGIAYRPYSVGKLGAWTVAHGSIDIVTSYWNPASGRQSVDLSGLQNAPGTIYQDIPTAADKTYVIRFSAAANPQPADVVNPKVMHVFWNNRKIAALTLNAQGRDFENVGWQIYEFEVKGKKSLSRITFQSLTQTPCGPILDDVSVSLSN